MLLLPLNINNNNAYFLLAVYVLDLLVITNTDVCCTYKKSDTSLEDVKMFMLDGRQCGGVYTAVGCLGRVESSRVELFTLGHNWHMWRRGGSPEKTSHRHC